MAVHGRASNGALPFLLDVGYQGIQLTRTHPYQTVRQDNGYLRSIVGWPGSDWIQTKNHGSVGWMRWRKALGYEKNIRFRICDLGN